MTDNMPLVAFLTTKYSPIHPIAKEILGKDFRVKDVFTPGRSFDDDVLKEVADADAILVRSGVVTREVMEAASKLKIVAVHGIGVDRVNLEVAEDRDIMVTNTPLANTAAVAEHTLGLILSLIRKIPLSDRLIKERKWEEARLEGRLLMRMTVGLVGFGNIGSRVAKRLKAFEARVVAYDPYVPLERFEELNVERTNLDVLLKESDVVSIHIPLTRFTRHMIGEEELRSMARDALLVNTSRGSIVDEDALCLALRENWISGAGLDVFEDEPLDSDSPLLELDQVVLTPHIAGSTDDSLKRMAETAAKDISRIFRGEKPIHEYRRESIPYPV